MILFYFFSILVVKLLFLYLYVFFGFLITMNLVNGTSGQVSLKEFWKKCDFCAIFLDYVLNPWHYHI